MRAPEFRVQRLLRGWAQMKKKRKKFAFAKQAILPSIHVFIKYLCVTYFVSWAAGIKTKSSCLQGGAGSLLGNVLSTQRTQYNVTHRELNVTWRALREDTKTCPCLSPTHPRPLFPSFQPLRTSFFSSTLQIWPYFMPFVQAVFSSYISTIQ